MVIMRAAQKAAIQLHDGSMKEFFGTHVSKDPRVTAVQHFTENQGIKELQSFLQCDILVVVEDFSVGIERCVCQCNSSCHFDPMIPFVMQDSS